MDELENKLARYVDNEIRLRSLAAGVVRNVEEAVEETRRLTEEQMKIMHSLRSIITYPTWYVGSGIGTTTLEIGGGNMR